MTTAVSFSFCRVEISIISIRTVHSRSLSADNLPFFNPDIEFVARERSYAPLEEALYLLPIFLQFFGNYPSDSEFEEAGEGLDLLSRLSSLVGNRRFEEDNSLEDQLRERFEISEDDDLYTGLIEHENTEKLNEARENNKDGEDFLKTVLENHVAELSKSDGEDFRAKITQFDPEIFVEVPKMAIEALINSDLPLTVQNTPRFIHSHLTELEALRKMHKKSKLALDSKEIKNGVGALATKLSRERDFTAALEGAIKKNS